MRGTAVDREVAVYAQLVRAFLNQGVNRLFGILGDANISFMMDMSGQRESQVIHVRHEAGAISMAAGYARLTGAPALVSVTSGPGLTHATTPLVSACQARLPMVVLAGDTASNGAFMGGLQEFDQKGLAKLVGAGYLRLDESADPESCAEEAVRIACAEQRPVILSVPVDLLESRAIGPRRASGLAENPMPQATSFLVSPSDQVDDIADSERDADDLIEALRHATRVVLVIGLGALRAEAVPKIEALAGLIDAHLGTTYRAKGSCDDNPRNLGIFGALAHAADQKIYDRADLMVGFGADLDGFGAFGSRLFSGRLIGVGEESKDDVVSLDRAARALHRVLDTCLSNLVGLAPKSSDLPLIGREMAVASDFEEMPAVYEPGQVDPRQLVIELDGLVADNAVIVVGAGHFWSFPIMYLPRRQRRFLFPIEFGSIGLALATGIGAALSDEATEVVVFEGDGGVLMGIQELETASRHHINLTLVVLNDAALGAEYHKLVGKGFAPEQAAYQDVAIADIARNMGATAVAVENLEEIVPAWQSRAPGMNVLDVKVSRLVTSRWYRRLYL